MLDRLGEGERANPFMFAGKWYWWDENGTYSKAYDTHSGALRDMLAYTRWMEDGPTLWERFWYGVTMWRLWLWRLSL